MCACETITILRHFFDQVQKNLASYTSLLKLQRSYDYTHANPGKYAITAGAKKRGRDDSQLLTEQEYSKSISSINTDERGIIRSYKLGSVEKYKW